MNKIIHSGGGEQSSDESPTQIVTNIDELAYKALIQFEIDEFPSLDTTRTEFTPAAATIIDEMVFSPLSFTPAEPMKPVDLPVEPISLENLSSSEVAEMAIKKMRKSKRST